MDVVLYIVAYLLIGAIVVFVANLYLLLKYNDIDGSWNKEDAIIVKVLSFIFWPIAVVVFICWQIFIATFSLANEINDEIREYQDKAKRIAAEKAEAERQAAVKKAMDAEDARKDETKFERSEDTNWRAR